MRCGCSTPSTWCGRLRPPWTTSDGRCSRTQAGHRGRTTDPLYGIRRLLRRGADHLSTKAWARLQAGLVAGDPDRETTLAWTVLAWTVAQQVRDLDQLDDPTAARNRVATLITAMRECPIAELARLGRTLHAWRDELVGHFDHPDVSNGSTENLNLKIKNTKRVARGYRKLRPLPAATVAQPRPHP